MEDNRRFAVMYTRVSSSEQLREGFSIAAQERVLREYAQREGLFIAAQFSDDETAKSVGRRGFGEMVTHLKRHRDHIVLVEKLDRLARNDEDAILLERMGIEIRLVKDGLRISKEMRAAQRFLVRMQRASAIHYVENLSEEVKKGMRQKAAQGAYPSWAPLGYLNAGELSEKRSVGIVTDPVKAPMVVKLFEAAARGASLGEVVKLAESIGLRGRFNARIGKSAMVKILKCRVYTGWFRWAGETYRGRYEPLISQELFDRVQRALNDRRKTKAQRHTFAFAGLVRCGECGRLLTGDRKKGRYVYYAGHCAHQNGRGIREEIVEREFLVALKSLVVPDAIRDAALADISKHYADEARRNAAATARSRTRLAEIEEMTASAYEEKLLGRVTEETWRRMISRWSEEAAKHRAIVAQATPAINGERISLAAREKFELPQLALRQWNERDAYEKGALVKTCVSNFVITRGSIAISMRSPFTHMAKMAVSGDWLGREDSNLRMAAPKAAALPLGDSPTSASGPLQDRAPADHSSLLGFRDRANLRVRRADVIRGRDDQLRAANARRDRDDVEQLDRLVGEYRIALLRRERGDAAADVAGERLHFLQRHGVDLLVAR